MWKEIINALRGKDVVRELSIHLGQMLDAGRWMFDQAAEALMREVDWHAVAGPLYEKDKQINRIEQQIREGIVTHLATGSHADLAACLVLMSVVKDAERIGDYCKNIFEVGRFYRRAYEHKEFRTPLDEIQKAVTDLFEPTKQAFLKEDVNSARRVLRATASLSKQCDTIIQQLLSMERDFPADEAVAYVLLARHYKRVAGHLGNIATSVVSPVPMLDFRRET
ncbi:MAG TPA: PhoU domain-containing protein [Phycisphaerae bacterium]|nr:PhoU domain-containing protein [Phycisphaerae bacterium]